MSMIFSIQSRCFIANCQGINPKGPRDSFPKESFGLEDALRYGPSEKSCPSLNHKNHSFPKGSSKGVPGTFGADNYRLNQNSQNLRMNRIFFTPDFDNSQIPIILIQTINSKPHTHAAQHAQWCLWLPAVEIFFTGQIFGTEAKAYLAY